MLTELPQPRLRPRAEPADADAKQPHRLPRRPVAVEQRGRGAQFPGPRLLPARDLQRLIEAGLGGGGGDTPGGGGASPPIGGGGFGGPGGPSGGAY